MNDLRELVGELERRRITRRRFVERALQLGLSATAIGVLLAACGKKPVESASPTALDTTLPEKIYFFTWSDYIDPAAIKDFEKQTGVKVVMTYFDDPDAVLAKLKAGATGYDVVNAPGWMTHVLWKTGLIQPLNMSYIPNFKNVTERFRLPAYDPEENGKKYSTPLTWGTTGIAVRLDKVSAPVTGWSSMWDPANKRQITMLDDMRETIGAAEKKLGFSCNTTDQSELDQATSALIEQKPLVTTYDPTPRRQILMGNALTHSWDGDCLRALQALGKTKVQYVLPQEGYVMWTDNFVIPTGAASPYAAHLFLNFWLDPRVAGESATYMQYFTPVTGWEQYTDPALLTLLPSEEDLKRGEFTDDLSEFGRKYSDAWTKVKMA